MTIDDRARSLFLHNHPDADPAMFELAWADNDIRTFWHDQVLVVLGVPAPTTGLRWCEVCQAHGDHNTTRHPDTPDRRDR